MKILIIEDELAIADFLKSSLERQLYIVDVASDGQRGAFLGRTNQYDLIILDYLLPKQNGLEVVKEIRLEKKTPIIMLTVKSELDIKKQAYDLEIDDFLTKPFLLDELFLRIRALLRRPRQIASTLMKMDNLSLDLRKQMVRRGGKMINLTRKEYIILEYLFRNRSEIKSREQIIENVWDMNADPFSNSLDTHIVNLRRKLNKLGECELIHTFPGRGYKLDLKKF
jgi:DNA-binding response OmpR family regulator